MSLRNHSFCRRFFGVFLCLALIASILLPMTAHAAYGTVYEGSIELTGEFDRRRFRLSTSDDDLFSLKNIIPGDSWHGKVHVKNNCGRIMEVSIISILNDLENDDYLFRQLSLDISIGDEVIYSGSYGETDEPVSDWYAISPGKKITFDIRVKLPEETGNEGQGREMDSTWIFEARVMEPSGGGGNNDHEADDDDELPYYVYYVDQNGNDLLDPKLGYGDYREVITEYAAYIPGYIPDAMEKTITLTRKNNEIIFVYTKTKLPSPPDSPSSPQPSNPVTPPDADPTPNPDNIHTGYDMTEGNSGAATWLLILMLCISAILSVYFRIRQVKKESDNKEV